MPRILINILFLGLAFYTGFYLIKPEWGKIESLKAETASYKETLENIEKMQDLRDELLDEYNSISDADKNKLENMFSNSLNEGELMLMFSELAKSSSLVVSDINLEGVREQSSSVVLGRKNESYVPYNLSIQAVGSYGAFKSFLKNMEKSLLIIDVSNISLSPQNSEGAGNDFYKFDIKASIYLKK